MSLYGGEKTTFKCFDCGNIFKGELHEWNHSHIIASAKCPKCGGWHMWPYNRDFPDDLEDLDSFSIVIWKRYDELRNNEENDDEICSVLELP